MQEVKRMSVGKRIKEMREKRGKTLLQVANYLGVSEATAQRYESGNIKNLKLDTITKLSQFLNVDPAYLMGWKSNAEDLVSAFTYDYYPITVSAGLPSDVDGVTNENVEKITVPNHLMGKWAGNKDIFMMKVNGESMNNIFPDKSVIAVKKVELSELSDGDIVIFSHDHEYSVKRIYNDKENKRFIFRPDSSDKTFIDYTVDYDDADRLTIHGKVVMYLVELD